MQEALLQFIWQYNLYRPGDLKTQAGESLQVIHPGTHNRDAGPDFNVGRIRLGDTLLVGNIELHVRTSDWLRHNHDDDPAYSRIILHVVFEDDMPGQHSGIPLLELKAHIPAYVIERYSNLIHTTASLPCAAALQTVSSITKTTWLGRMLVERWEQKLHSWQFELERCGGDWLELCWWRLAGNFGFKVNATPFLLLAQSVPLRILLKQPSLQQVEALLFGQAGFLAGNVTDEYQQGLQKEYAFLQHKYSLRPVEHHLWKFLRLRPVNFPTVRLAQLAALIYESPAVFSAFSGKEGVPALMKMLAVKASSYWDTHYRFGEAAARRLVKYLGNDAAHNLIVNTVAPMRFLYAHTHGKQAEAEQALQLLESLPPEDNKITRMWAENNWKAPHAADSQSLIQLFNSYCASKRCLECAVGLSIIRSRPDK